MQPRSRCILLLAAAAALPACWPMVELARPDDLPDRVLLRTATESFNQEWYAAVRDGRIWIKPNADSGSREGDWQPLGGTGLPNGLGVLRFDPPQHIDEISVDGIFIIALSRAGVFYRGVNMTQDAASWIEWQDSWGWPASWGDGLTVGFSTARGWSVSDAHPLGVDHYEDINGTEHSVGMSVAHAYRLSEDGRCVHYNDWWLPNDWSRRICGPERSTLVGANISASASTLFVVGEQGQLYTRLYDFDTSGESDLLTYSYVIDGPAGTTRALPAEPWRRQPDPPGRITRRVTIFQTGQGNAARTLRVEGAQEGRTGYFEKAIFDPAWRFVETGQDIAEPFLDPDRPRAEVEPDDAWLAGSLTRQGSAVRLHLEILDFNLFCSPARVRLLRQGRPISADGQPLELTLHHVHAMATARRPLRYWEQGIDADIRGALLIPPQLARVDEPAARAELIELLGDRQVINLRGAARPDHLELLEISKGEWFQVPDEEKGEPGSLFTLRAD